MEVNDIQAIREIDDRSFTLPYSDGIWEREDRNPISQTLVVVDDGGEGTPELRGYLNFWFILDEAEIHRIAVQEQYRRSGIAGRLLHEMFKILQDMGILSVHLEVRQSNNDAIKLYDKFGFMVKGRRKGYYQETGEDALIMRADLNIITQEK
jgi:[ribosomal protein S18]-alanine N-acetyltransferase